MRRIISHNDAAKNIREYDDEYDDVYENNNPNVSATESEASEN